MNSHVIVRSTGRQVPSARADDRDSNDSVIVRLVVRRLQWIVMVPWLVTPGHVGRALGEGAADSFCEGPRVVPDERERVQCCALVSEI